MTCSEGGRKDRMKERGENGIKRHEVTATGPTERVDWMMRERVDGELGSAATYSDKLRSFNSLSNHSHLPTTSFSSSHPLSNSFSTCLSVILSSLSLFMSLSSLLSVNPPALSPEECWMDRCVEGSISVLFCSAGYWRGWRGQLQPDAQRLILHWWECWVDYLSLFLSLSHSLHPVWFFSSEMTWDMGCVCDSLSHWFHHRSWGRNKHTETLRWSV